MASIRRSRPRSYVPAGFFAILFALALAHGIDAFAADEAPATPVAKTSPRYRVSVEAPAALKETIEREVGLVRWQHFPEMTPELLDRLAREAIDEVRDVAAADGHFSAVIDVSIDRAKEPVAVILRVEAGPLTHVTSVRITVSGPATQDTPLGTDAIAQLTREWSLPVGAVFRQPAWQAGKERAVVTLAASPYAAARIAKSEAVVDPARASADLVVEIDSGPAFRFGRLEISGLVRYDEALVRNFSAITPGEPYSERTLERFVRRLNASGYFASARARIDAETEHPDDATVFVAVIEAPTRRFEGGLGYSTDVEFRVNANYRDVNVNGRGLQLLADGRAETKIQTASLRFTLPPNEAGWIGTFGAGATRTDIESLVTRTVAAGTRWHTVVEQDERALSAYYYFDQQHPSGAAAQTAHAVYAEVERYWRRVDNLVAPTQGWMASAQAGGGIPGVSTRGFGRFVGRFASWVPLDQAHELSFRAEGGAVLAGSRDGIPSTLLFRTGGDTTVRGYAFDSLGVQDGDAIVPGRYYAVTSVDLTRWISPAWGIAAFVDAGNAVDSLSGARLAFGYGAGVRVRTPLGPFRLDLAYGEQSQEVRLHFSVGLTF